MKTTSYSNLIKVTVLYSALEFRKMGGDTQGFWHGKKSFPLCNLGLRYAIAEDINCFFCQVTNNALREKKRKGRGWERSKIRTHLRVGDNIDDN